MARSSVLTHVLDRTPRVRRSASGLVWLWTHTAFSPDAGTGELCRSRCRGTHHHVLVGDRAVRYCLVARAMVQPPSTARSNGAELCGREQEGGGCGQAVSGSTFHRCAGHACRSFRRLVNRSAHLLLAILLLTGFPSGCSGLAGSSSERDALTRLAKDVDAKRSDHPSYEHDLGRVFAGEELCHTFVFENPTGKPISVSNDEGIRKDCGCASIGLSSRHLEPGGTVQVTVTVRTSDRSGRIVHGGVVHWKTLGGQDIPAKFQVSAIVVPPIQASPTHLTFGQEEVERNLTKTLTLTSNLPIDWKTLRISSSSEYTQFKLLPARGNQRQCDVRFAIPTNVGNASSNISVRARVRPNSPRLPGQEVSTYATVSGKHDVQVAWKPSVLLVAFTPSTKGRSVGRVFLYGRKISGSLQPVKSIVCAGYDVTFSTVARVRDGVLLNLQFARTSNRIPDKEMVVLTLVEGDRVAIPLLAYEGEPLSTERSVHDTNTVNGVGSTTF